MRSCPDTDIDSKSERSVKDAGVRKPGTGALHPNPFQAKIYT